MEILKALRDTPLPIVLVIGGLFFLLVPFIRRVSDKIEVETTHRGFAGFIGFILLSVGIGLYIIPPQTSATPTPTNAPPISSTVVVPSQSVVIQPSATLQNTPEPLSTIAVQEVIYDCPIYQETGKGKSLSLFIDVPSGEIAFFDGYGFDNQSGRVFVTITGPYQGQHTITDGAYCSGIDTKANYTPLKEQRLQQCASCKQIQIP